MAGRGNFPVLTSAMTGRLGGTGYLSILPVAQGVEHSAVTIA